MRCLTVFYSPGLVTAVISVIVEFLYKSKVDSETNKVSNIAHFVTFLFVRTLFKKTWNIDCNLEEDKLWIVKGS